MRTDTAANGREAVGLLHLADALDEIAYLYPFNKRGDINPHRTAHHALRIGTVQAPLGFLHGRLGIQTQVHFIKIQVSHFRISFGHFLTSNLHPFFDRNGFPQLFPPLFVEFGPEPLLELSRHFFFFCHLLISSLLNLYGNCFFSQ